MWTRKCYQTLNRYWVSSKWVTWTKFWANYPFKHWYRFATSNISNAIAQWTILREKSDGEMHCLGCRQHYVAKISLFSVWSQICSKASTLLFQQGHSFPVLLNSNNIWELASQWRRQFRVPYWALTTSCASPDNTLLNSSHGRVNVLYWLLFFHIAIHRDCWRCTEP